MKNYFSLSLFTLISINLWEINIADTNCIGLDSSPMEVGEKYMKGNDCHICECKTPGALECIRHIDCEFLDCKYPTKYEKHCCKEFNCKNTSDFSKSTTTENKPTVSDSTKTHFKENTAKINITSTEHPYAPKLAKHHGLIASLIFCSVLIIIFAIGYIKKSARSTFRQIRHRPLYEGYARFDTSHRFR